MKRYAWIAGVLVVGLAVGVWAQSSRAPLRMPALKKAPVVQKAEQPGPQLETLEDVIAFVKRLDTRLARVEDRLGPIHRDLTLEQLDKDIESVDRRMDRLEQKMRNLSSDVDRLR